MIAPAATPRLPAPPARRRPPWPRGLAWVLVLTCAGTVHAQNEAAVARQRLKGLDQRVKASALAGNVQPLVQGVIAPAPAPPVKNPGSRRLTLDAADQQLVARSLRDVLQEDTLTAFPNVVQQIGPDRSELNLIQYVLAGEPLKFSPASGRFEGSIKIGVANLDAPLESKALAYPLTFQVLESGLADPIETVIAATSPPHRSIAIRTSDVSQPVIIHVASPLTPAGAAVTLPLVPTLRLEADRWVIQGFGLETTRLHVSTLGLAEAPGRQVTLSADGSAFIEPSALTLDARGTASALLRSSGSGEVVVRASMPGLTPAAQAIGLAFPWRTLAAAAVGGLAGGLIRVATGLRRRTPVWRIALALGLSTLIGLLVFGLAAVGVNLLPVTFPVTVGEIYVMVVAALGGWLGIRVLRPLGAG